MRGSGQYGGHERLRIHQCWWTRKKSETAGLVIVSLSTGSRPRSFQPP